jgi:hypothetical protein
MEDDDEIDAMLSQVELSLLAVVKSHLETLVRVQLCSAQGVPRFSFVHLLPGMSRPFTSAPVYSMSLTYEERLRVVGCGLKGRLARLLSLGMSCTTTKVTTTTSSSSTTSASPATQTSSITATTSTTTVTTNITTLTITTHQTRYFEPQRNWGACHKMMQSIVRRVTAGLAAAVRDKITKEAEELCASRQRAAAIVRLQRAIDFGDLSSRALKAWLHITGREGVANFVAIKRRAFKLVEVGARFGCHHCQGVLAYCYMYGIGCNQDEARSLELARESSVRGSRYGQYTLGALFYSGKAGLAKDVAQAVAFYRLAAAQGLDQGHYSLGRLMMMVDDDSDSDSDSQSDSCPYSYSDYSDSDS